MLDDRKHVGDWGWPLPSGRRLIIHYRDEPDDGKRQGTGSRDSRQTGPAKP